MLVAALLAMLWFVPGSVGPRLVIVAAPLMYVPVHPLLRPTTRRQAAERAETGRLTAIAGDIAAGIRVLRGVGGEVAFSDTYRTQSTRAREAGEAAGRWQALIRTSSVLSAGVLLVALAWLGVDLVRAGSLSVGALIALFGYATFLTWPIDTLFGFGQTRWASGSGKSTLSPACAQQIAIARILAADPPVMILDEATSLLTRLRPRPSNDP